MASPFAVFRRNQKVMTVILTCLAMFAFIILGSLEQMDAAAIVPVIFGLGGAALAWLWGSQNERGISYPTICAGALLGAIAGGMLASQAGSQGGVSTSLGRLSNRDLLEMKQKRDMANQFVIGAFRERKENASASRVDQYLFGQTSTRDVVIKQLLAHEADQLGIEVSDEYITKYIKEVSENNISRKKLTELRGQIGLGESELYDLLRTELRAQVAYRVLNPELVHMPDQYWGDFEKLNVRHSIDAVAIPVEPFAARLPRPSDAEINEVFEAFKGVYAMGENPGFVQPDRLTLAWFESEGVSDYEAVEKLVGEISDEELKARYEERKDIEYKIERLPDLDSGFDDGGLKFGEPQAPVKITPPAADEKSTDDAATPEAAATPGDSKADPVAKPNDAAPADSPKSEEAAPTEDASAKTKPADGDSEPEKECGDGDNQESDQSKDEETNDEKPEATLKETPTTESKPAEDSKPEGETPAKPADSSKESTEETPAPDLSEVKYRSFEEVRDDIRDRMLREKTEERIEQQEERIKQQISAAITAVKDWRFKFREAKPEVVKKAPNVSTDSVEYQEYLDEVKKDHDLYNSDLAAGIATKAEAYAEENGLKFVNPDEFFSQQELIEHDEHKIGTAREPFDPSNFMAQTQPQTASARLFTGATTLFIPEEAQGQFDDTRYAFWATGEKEQHVPTLDEPGVREQVEKAVRLKNARSDAKLRADDLAKWLAGEFAKPSIVTMAEGVAGQSIFGDKVPPTAKPEGGSSTTPAAEPEGDSSTPPAAEPEGDSSTEPAAEPEGDSSTEPAAEPDGDSSPEPAAEPEGDSSTEPAAEPKGDSSTAPAEANDGAAASDESEKEESCDDEQGDATAPAETETEESKPAAAETSSEEATTSEETSSEEAASDEVIDEPLSVMSSPPFTWYRQSSLQGMQMNRFAQPTIEFGFIPGIDGVDDNFMKTVSETPVGEVVVIPNFTKQVYYVIYVKARVPSGDDDPSLAPVRQKFIDGVKPIEGRDWTVPIPMSPIYERLANSQGSEIHQAWLADFFAKHNVSVEELDAI